MRRGEIGTKNVKNRGVEGVKFYLFLETRRGIFKGVEGYFF